MAVTGKKSEDEEDEEYEKPRAQPIQTYPKDGVYRCLQVSIAFYITGMDQEFFFSDLWVTESW